MTSVYNFHPISGEFLTATTARIDPMDDAPMLPANATFTAPPEVYEHEVAIWDGAVWAVVPDHRGTEYWLADGTHHKIETIGETPPPAALETPPPPSLDEQKMVALDVAHRTASSLRAQVVNVTPDRAIALALKATMAVIGLSADPNGPLKVAYDAAHEGYQIEANLTGDDPAELMQRSQMKMSALFKVNQLIEAMERLAERDLNAATTSVELQTAIADLQTKEAAAMAQLEALTQQ